MSTSARRLHALMDSPAVRVVVEARLGNCGPSFDDISRKGLASMRKDAQFVRAINDTLGSLEVQTDYIQNSPPNLFS